ncbi:hypothetical protein RE628_07490 [Paenibacillus sp. D2_2]|uniref:hypothetical protein n=1 Tax=Paenibacillus sp. D2_2 TaxID=3073092 RepID=UPI00281503F3|nr:hypothetical protein [Paenibacillus sp. D2_2]WMT42240.1 hypothetical protein RE628_07490 [Paenibacillus sp. D2_2]
MDFIEETRYSGKLYSEKDIQLNGIRDLKRKPDSRKYGYAGFENIEEEPCPGVN